MLGWLNADDHYLPDAVAEGVRALAETGAGLVYADVTRVNDDGDNPRRIRSRPTWDFWTEVNANGIFSPSVFFTREALDAAGELDESLQLTMDYDLWLRIGKRFPVHHVDAVWSVQRIHDDAKTMSQYDAFWPERLRVSRRHGGRLVSPAPDPTLHQPAGGAARGRPGGLGRIRARRQAAREGLLRCAGSVASSRSTGRRSEQTVEVMLDDLAHRGPDGRGVFEDDGVCLGHLRLAIIDLSERGLQPFASDDGRLQLLHNGEIYNYLELREQLRARGHSFRSETDTEVILAAYREWGEACVRRFNGMWAFALWDAAERTLFCSRDRLGVKPFYYRHDGNRFAFASEPWTLRGAAAGEPPGSPRLPRAGLPRPRRRDLLRRRAEAAARAFADVRPNGLRLERYWSLERRAAPAEAGRRRPRDLRRRGPARAAQRRPRGHLPLGRDRLLGDRDRRRAPRPRPPEDGHRILRRRGLRRAALRPSRRRADRCGGALDLVHGRRPRREPARDRAGAGRALRLDLDLRRVVRDARGAAGQASR